MKRLYDRFLPETQAPVIRLGQAARNRVQRLMEQRPPATIARGRFQDRDATAPVLPSEERVRGHLTLPFQRERSPVFPSTKMTICCTSPSTCPRALASSVAIRVSPEHPVFPDYGR